MHKEMFSSGKQKKIILVNSERLTKVLENSEIVVL